MYYYDKNNIEIDMINKNTNIAMVKRSISVSVLPIFMVLILIFYLAFVFLPL